MNLSPHPASPDLTLPESVEEAFTLLQETLGFDRLAARQDVDGTIRPDEIETFSATKTLLESLPEVRIEGACEGPAEFKLGQTLGEGGMGVVRLADQVSLHRSVAVKTLRPEKSSDAALLALLREAWVTGALEHPNIVPVYALGRNEEKMPVFVMKRVEGTPWSTLLADPTHPLVARGGGDKDPLHFHLELLLKVCDALAFAHSRQLIHRDVKPENVMLGAFGEVYLLDWGIAVSLDDTSLFPKASEVRSVSGTPAYMAPEMVESKGVGLGVWTDVFLVGAVLHEVLTGRAPNRGESLMGILAYAFRAPSPQFAADVPGELAAICRRALERAPQARFASVSELKRAIEDYQEHRASSRLTREAQERLAQLEALAAGGEQERRSVEFYRFFGECHFGFQQALGSWPENTEAAEGKTRAVRRMVEFELERENADAAAAWLTELPPDDELEVRLAALRRGLSEKSAEIDKLRKLEADVDIDFGKRDRSVGALVEAMVWLVTNLVFGVLARAEVYVVGTLDYFYLTLFAGAVSPLIVWPRHKVLLGNAVNRRILISLSVFFATSALFWLFAWFVGIPFENAVPLVLTLFASGALVLAAFVETKLIYSGAAYLLAAVATVAFPQFSYEMLGLGSFVGFGVVAYLWSPLEVCAITGRVLSSHLGEVSRRRHV